MWRRRRQEAAARAIVAIVHHSVLYMRAMGHTRESMCDDVFPGTDYSEQIRELADVCDNLVPGLTPHGHRSPFSALHYTWGSRSEQQRAWMLRCLESRHVSLNGLALDAKTLERTRCTP
jgi:hypothetical protein